MGFTLGTKPTIEDREVDLTPKPETHARHIGSQLSGRFPRPQ